MTIVRRACEEPIRQIVNNGGVEGSDCCRQGARHSPIPHFGFNGATGEYQDLVAAGIIDPAKVTRSALQNAASIASLMLTTEALICGIVED